MKKILILIICFSIFCVKIKAQQTGEVNQQRHKKGRAEMMQQLNLSDEQKKQAKLYQEEFKNQMLELNKGENITVKEYRDKKDALRKQQKEKMQRLLTAEQKTKIDQMKADRKAKADEHFAKRIEKMQQKLNLTSTQVAEMKRQRSDMQDRCKAIKENETLSRAERKAQLTQLKSLAKEQRKKIFTTEQLKQLEEMKMKRMEKGRR